MVRTEPVQQRSSQRITLLLDAAAALIDENGIDSLTTSDVAARSNSSVGVVYRYFPNIQSLLRALAARNLQQYTGLVAAALAGDSQHWRSAIDPAIDAFIQLSRTQVGFRGLRFGDVIDDRFLDPILSNNGVLAREFAAMLGSRYGFEPTEQIEFDLEVIVEIEDALMRRAFLHDKQGDERFIAKAREIAQEYMRNHTSLPGADS
jgi:AcrR family transcriptional regulator